MAYVYRHIRLDKNEPFYIGIGLYNNDYKYYRAYANTNKSDIEFLVYISDKREMSALIEYIKEKKLGIEIEPQSDKMITIKNF